VKRAPAASPEREAIWHDVECGAYRADLSLWLELRDSAGPGAENGCDLLELGCGTGRVSLSLAGNGCRVTGLDLDPGLVAVLCGRAAERGLPIEGVVADARSFALDRRFDLVLAPMQLAQLLPSEQERSSMLHCIARHLKPDARAALALLDLDDEWEAREEDAPPPDMLEADGWLYSSQPVAVRRLPEEQSIELDRVRRAVSPDGQLSESFSRTKLALISAATIEREASLVGLVSEPSRAVAATKDHVASTVVLLRPNA
jgi:SAM-dependent methyltransferase